MSIQHKYLLAFTIAHIFSALLLIKEGKYNMDFSMYSYFLVPMAIFIVTSVAHKYIKSLLLWALPFLIILICNFIFWTNSKIVKEVVLYKPDYVCVIYLIIMIISAIGLPYIRPNEWVGIRIPQTQSYPNVWRRTHIFTSLLLSTMIVPAFIVIVHYEFIYRFIWCNVFLGGSLVIGTIYAVIITVPIDRQEKMQIDKELQEQVKKEQGYR